MKAITEYTIQTSRGELKTTDTETAAWYANQDYAVSAVTTGQ